MFWGEQPPFMLFECGGRYLLGGPDEHPPRPLRRDSSALGTSPGLNRALQIVMPALDSGRANSCTLAGRVIS